MQSCNHEIHNSAPLYNVLPTLRTEAVQAAER